MAGPYQRLLVGMGDDADHQIVPPEEPAAN
jgi:hypothetical protein